MNKTEHAFFTFAAVRNFQGVEANIETKALMLSGCKTVLPPENVTKNNALSKESIS